MLEIRALESHYGRIPALKGIDLRIAEGELVALVGANGAGKTTLLRALSGVQRVSAGQVLFRGEDITRCTPDRARSNVVLPAPLAPTSATSSPSATRRSMPFSAGMRP